MAKKRTLPTDRRDEAEKIAMQPYSVLVFRDKTTNGEPIFLAVNPELDGCMAHGKTSEEAGENLKEARIDYIQVMLLSGTSIPIPAAMKEAYTNPIGAVTMKAEFFQPSKTQPLGSLIIDVAQPEQRQAVGEYVIKVLSPSGA